MTVLVWKVPSFVGNAFCTAIIGFVLGRKWFLRLFVGNRWLIGLYSYLPDESIPRYQGSFFYRDPSHNTETSPIAPSN